MREVGWVGCEWEVGEVSGWADEREVRGSVVGCELVVVRLRARLCMRLCMRLCGEGPTLHLPSHTHILLQSKAHTATHCHTLPHSATTAHPHP